MARVSNGGFTLWRELSAQYVPTFERSGPARNEQISFYCNSRMTSLLLRTGYPSNCLLQWILLTGYFTDTGFACLKKRVPFIIWGKLFYNQTHKIFLIKINGLQKAGKLIAQVVLPPYYSLGLA